MIAALRRKLALLLTGVLSAVVLCTALAALIVSERQMEESEWVRLMAQVERVAQDVRIGNVLQASELGKMEAADGLRHLHCGWRRAHPLPRRLADADGEGDPGLARTGGCGGADGGWQGTVTGEHGERYLAAACFLNDYRNARTVVVLRDMREADAQRRVQRLLYAGIALAALAVIALFCWFFTGRAVRPIREAHETQNRFVSAASHELRTPLQVIRFNAEALKLEPPDPTPFIGQILKELTHMGRLSEDLLL